MKIGITEWNDAGIDFRWEDKLENLNGVILITKSVNNVFRKKVLAHMDKLPIIVHCTCTGWGASPLESNVPSLKKQLDWLKELIDSGFPAKQVVLRIDPIFPSEKGLKRVAEVLDYAKEINLPMEDIRCRISIVDEYPHVRKRFESLGWTPLYGGNFYASWAQMEAVGELLQQYPYKFATCAEDKLVNKFPSTFEIKGCISRDDLEIMNVEYDEKLFENPQKRSGCHCLSCKTELLKPREKCSHGCVYCYWKD